MGVFSVDKAIPIDEVVERFEDGAWTDIVHPMDTAVLQLPAIVVDLSAVQMLRHGQRVASGTVATTSTSELHRVYSIDGSFVALANFKSAEGIWQPHKVFAS